MLIRRGRKEEWREEKREGEKSDANFCNPNAGELESREGTTGAH